MYNVLIVEDQTMPRKLLEIYVNEEKDFNLVASISNASLALDICKRSKIDLILMDVLTELGNNGLDEALLIKKYDSNIKIIIVTSMPEASWLKKAKENKIDSFWYKDGDSNSIIDVMKRTMNGESIFPLDTPTIQFGNASNHDFSERELDILRELITGDSNIEIGKRLGLSANTVKWYIQGLLDKTGFHTRTELAAVARSLGIAIK
ncbi:response regulator transcription factor [Anaeroplasma bactoclasticum]|jgi:two-component system vancomycin resistance associated response regulator VraR|nr:response regulator transcription factor [Anaeroplasma bactoclasticum]